MTFAILKPMVSFWEKTFLSAASAFLVVARVCSAVAAGPVLVGANPSAGGGAELTDFVVTMGVVVNKLVPIVTAFACLCFFFGLVKFLFHSGDEEKRKSGKAMMIWGVFAMFVLATIWGLIGFMQKTMGNTSGAININVITPGVSGRPVIGSPFSK